jgi:hypothetical protein
VVLLGIAGVTFVAALPVALWPHHHGGAVAAEQQASQAAEGRAPTGFGGARSLGGHPGLASERSSNPVGYGGARRAQATPGPGGQACDPPSPAEAWVFNGAGFPAPSGQPEVVPVVRTGTFAADHAVTCGPLYYSSVSEAIRVTRESREMDKSHARLDRRLARE